MFRAISGALLFMIIMWPFLAASESYDIVKGTESDDIIFGDLGQFSGRNIFETGGLNGIMYSLDKNELIKIGSMLELKNGIEGLDDNADAIYGRDGNDIIFAQGGDDYIDAGSGEDIVFAGSGNDIIICDPDDKFIDGGSGVDVLVAWPFAPSLHTLKENKVAHDIEILLVMDKNNFFKGLPGIKIANDKIFIDSNIWQTTPDGVGFYVARDNSECKLEVYPKIDAIFTCEPAVQLN